MFGLADILAAMNPTSIGRAVARIKESQYLEARTCERDAADRVERWGNFIGFDLDIAANETMDVISRRAFHVEIVLNGDAVIPNAIGQKVIRLALGEVLCLPYRQFAYRVVQEVSLPLPTDATTLPRLWYGFALSPPVDMGTCGGRLASLPVETGLGGQLAAGVTVPGIATQDPGVFPFPAGTSCRYVRLQNTGPNPIYWAKGIIATIAAHELLSGDGIDVQMADLSQLSVYAPLASPSTFTVTPMREV